jgi:charged multivesicular body protein 4
MPLFGKKKVGSEELQSQVRISLQNSLEMLGKRKSFLETKVDTQTKDAKIFLAQKNKKQALMCIKRKRIYEKQITALEGAISTIENQLFLLEESKINKEIINSMKIGADSMKGIRGDTTTKDIDDMMFDINEQIELSNEISSAISQPIVQYDEDELLNELEELTNPDYSLLEIPKKITSLNEPLVEASLQETTSSKKEPVKKLEKLLN